MERWIPILSYAGYSVSDLGRIRNDKRDSILSVVCSTTGHTYVGLMHEGIQVKRAVAKIVTDSFFPKPTQEHFTTPIHLNGDLSNCHLDNLLLRPRWFAMKFTQQFKREPPEHAPIRNKKTGETFRDCWPLVMRYGLLYLDIVIATSNCSYVFPTMQTFEWVI